ncbi:glycosyl hydrolase family 32, partial [Streptomyces sp. NPDC031705]
HLDPGGAWGPEEEFGEPGVVLAGTPSAAADAGGRIHLFAVTADGRMRTRVQERPGGGWRPWTAFGERPVAPQRPGSPAY